MKKTTMAFGRTVLLLGALAVSVPVVAQTLPPGQVSGKQLQTWMDADGFMVGGLNLLNQCHFMARNTGTVREMAVFCPGQPMFVVRGEGRVQGDQLCSKFEYPDKTRLDACHEIVQVAEGRYEVRAGGQRRSVLQRIAP